MALDPHDVIVVLRVMSTRLRRYRRIASRRGPIKAIVAVEHAMLIATWHMVTNGVFYDDLGGDFYTKRNPDKTKQRALDQLRQMGYQVDLQPLKAAG